MQFTSDLCLMNLDGGAEEKRKTEKMTSAFELKSSFLTIIIKKTLGGGVYPLMIACKQFGFTRWTDGGQLAVLVFLDGQDGRQLTVKINLGCHSGRRGRRSALC